MFEFSQEDLRNIYYGLLDGMAWCTDNIESPYVPDDEKEDYRYMYGKYSDLVEKVDNQINWSLGL